MRAFFLGDACESGAIETDTIQVTLEGRFLRRREIHHALGFLNRVQRSDFPLAFGDLSEQLAVETVDLEMSVSRAFAGPQEALAVLEELQIVADIDRIGLLLAERGRCLAAG